MFESVLQVLAYTGVGLAVLMAGFLMLDVLTPGRLGHHIMQGNPGAPGCWRRPRCSRSA